MDTLYHNKNKKSMANKSYYQKLDMSTLCFQGKAYPSDMEILVRPATVVEMRHWANIDEQDPLSVSTHILDIIESCVLVESSLSNKYSYKDLYEVDKIALLLNIYNLTFSDTKNNNLFVKGQCDAIGCGKVFDKLIVQPANICYKVPEESMHKYLDHEHGIFKIETKTFGTIEYKPATIGLGQALMAWVGTFDSKFVRDNMAMFKLVQSMFTDWRLANDKALRTAQVEGYNMWPSSQLSFRLQLLEKFEFEVLQYLEYVCPACGQTFRCPLAFAGGYKSLFIPVQSFDDELL
jgi:hypothetical protein